MVYFKWGQRVTPQFMREKSIFEPKKPDPSAPALSNSTFSLSSGYAESSLWLTPAERLERDVNQVRALEYTLQQQTSLCPDRLLCIVSCSTKDDAYLAGSLPALIEEVQTLEKHVDILVGLNNGALTPQTKSAIRTYNNIIVEQTYCTPKQGADIPAEVRAIREPERKYFIRDIQNADNHRVLFVHQPQSRFNRGKIRMLQDIYNLCSESAQAGAWSVPAQLLTIDAETHFMGEGLESQRGALAQLIEEKSNKDLRAIGTRWNLMPFEENKGLRLPQPLHPISTEHSIIEQLYGEQGFRYMPGGGTLGDSLFMLAVGHTASRYPGLRQEDILMTVLTNSSGEQWGLSDEVHSANKCVPAAHPHAQQHGRAQIHRWYAGIHALSRHYGVKSMQEIADPQVFERATTYSTILSQTEPDQRHCTEEALRALALIASEAGKSPDDIVHAHRSQAHW